MMTPMVANITDDNTDGVIDERDNPDVVFISYVDGSYTQNGILRVVDGRTSVADLVGLLHLDVVTVSRALLQAAEKNLVKLR